ncbi:hypothetical protein [Streptomyces sp. NPDC006631]|jgi:hypothetical protein|uniref:hypothetical protein n=1 Tax=Streptomyces sp. NPDC006631 TaxID=3364752 RepID=UPI0036CF3C3F
MAKHRKPHRADDKRRPGMSDNSKRTVSDGATGSAKPLAIFNDRRGANGNGKRAK